jgi:hypothetical protein
MAAYFSGSDGWMYLDKGQDNANGDFENADKAAAVTNWSLQTAMTPIEATTLGDTDTVFTPGLRTTTGQCTLLYYKQDSGGNKAAQLLNSLVKQRTDADDVDVRGQAAKADEVIFKLGLDDENSNERFIYVRAYLTNVSTSMAVGEVMRVNAQFRVLGAPNRVAITN